jgi:hypothetical protein
MWQLGENEGDQHDREAAPTSVPQKDPDHKWINKPTEGEGGTMFVKVQLR